MIRRVHRKTSGICQYSKQSEISVPELVNGVDVVNNAAGRH